MIKGDYLSLLVVDGLGNLDGAEKIAVLGNYDQRDGKRTELRLVSEVEKELFRFRNIIKNFSNKGC